MASTHVETVTNAQRRKLVADATAQLVKNAVDCTYYVACGNATAKDLADKFGLELEEARGLLSVAATDLVNHIREHK